MINKKEIKNTIARQILIVYYTIKGFLFSLKYLHFSRFKGRLFYSKALGKLFQHIENRDFITTYTMTSIGVEQYTQKKITLTFRDLGLYNMKLLGGWKNGIK